MAESSYAATNISLPDVRQKASETSRLANENPDTKRQDLPWRSDKVTRNEQLYQAVRVHHYTPKEAAIFVGLLYFSISMIAKRFHETVKS
jgi:hypothetical protein